MFDQANNIAQIILAAVLVGSVFVGLIAWCIKLQMQVSSIKEHIKDEDKAKDILWAKIDDLQRSINQLLVQMGRLEERIEHGKD